MLVEVERLDGELTPMSLARVPWSAVAEAKRPQSESEWDDHEQRLVAHQERIQAHLAEHGADLRRRCKERAEAEAEAEQPKRHRTSAEIERDQEAARRKRLAKWQARQAKRELTWNSGFEVAAVIERGKEMTAALYPDASPVSGHCPAAGVATLNERLVERVVLMVRVLKECNLWFG
jgi:hypothetical protein